ncbi:MAG: winged helix-turn-helix transcriptional regulator [Muribaculaceae bacterium]
MRIKLDYSYCKAAPILEWIGNKWTLVVLIRIAESEPIRFNDLYRNIPSISEKVLSATLKQLTNDGLIKRTLYADVPPKVEYSITDFGNTLLPLIDELIRWGKDYFNQIIENRKYNTPNH